MITELQYMIEHSGKIELYDGAYGDNIVTIELESDHLPTELAVSESVRHSVSVIHLFCADSFAAYSLNHRVSTLNYKCSKVLQLFVYTC